VHNVLTPKHVLQYVLQCDKPLYSATAVCTTVKTTSSVNPILDATRIATPHNYMVVRCGQHLTCSLLALHCGTLHLTVQQSQRKIWRAHLRGAHSDAYQHNPPILQQHQLLQQSASTSSSRNSSSEQTIGTQAFVITHSSTASTTSATTTNNGMKADLVHQKTARGIPTLRVAVVVGSELLMLLYSTKDQ
jgi:hypothetical protein